MSALALFFLFAKIGFFTFGGGYAMIPLFQYELVTSRCLLTPEEFANLIALAQVTPGPIGMNAATYIGMTEAGIPGAIAGTLGVMMPSLTIGLVIALVLKKFSSSPVVASLLRGIRPITLGLIAAAVIFFANTSVFTAPLTSLWQADSHFGISWQGLLIFLVTLAVSHFWKKVNPVWLLIGGALLGALIA